jgi:ribonuclease P protein component
MAGTFRFRRGQRLTSAVQFERVYRHGSRCGDALFGVSALANDCGRARLGLAVGAKAVGAAVRRNEVRRVIRETFRLRAPSLPAVDLVVTARPAARSAPRAAMTASLERLIGRACRLP